ncbi:MAG: hypothetical protein VW500_03150 [Aquiluna sp.]|jgi:hypothetical protein
MAKNDNRSKIEIILGSMAIGVIGLSILSMFSTLLLVFLGVSELPPILAQLPLIGLPIGFLIIIAMLIAAMIRRSREARE